MKYVFLMGVLGVGMLQAQSVSNDPFFRINSLRDEQNPVLSSDRRALYFTIANHPQNVGGKRDKGDIWFSVLMGDMWSAPVHAGDVLNDAGYNAVLGVLGNESLLLMGHYGARDLSRYQGVSISQKVLGSWSQPKNISITHFFNRSPSFSGFMLPGKNVLVFSGKSYYTQGAEDIYVSIRDASGVWGEPINLENTINTPYEEYSPWISEDTQYLYFSSNGHAGYGSFDIYCSQRLDTTWTHWSTPVNLGRSINSEGRELFYSFDSEKGIGLYTTTQDSDGYGDIRMHSFADEFIDSLRNKAATGVDSMARVVGEEVGSDRKKRIKVWGTVRGKKTGNPVDASLRFHVDSVVQRISISKGVFSTSVPRGDTYRIWVEALGYVSDFKQVDLRMLEEKGGELNIQLNAIEVGAMVYLSSVLFKQGTDRFLKESFDELDMVVAFMQHNPGVEIDLAGYTDNQGIQSHNVKLSHQRVKKVEGYLIDRGIDKGRISGKGYGSLNPIADNRTEETRRLNRRVEFTIVKK